MDQTFTFIGNQDLNGILRGRSVPSARAEAALAEGLPWVPANITIGAHNLLPPDNPFGPIGEIRLLPDPSAFVSLPRGAAPAFDLVLCDLAHHDGTPWTCCPRGALRRALAELERETGLTLKVAFEHEFTVHGLGEPTHVAFSPSAGRAGAALAERVLAVLDTGGFALDQFVAEYGPGQYEIAGQPADPMTAADRTVLTLEAIRASARDLGLRASFLPKPALDQVGNGVHVHFSLWKDGRNVTTDGAWIAGPAAAFLAGLLEAAEALTLLSVTSPNSFARYRPQTWVGTYVCAGLRNREAMVRLVPRARAADGSHPGASLEFRTSDATANVYLMLTGLVRAGLDGIRAGLPAPSNVERDPETLGADGRAELGLRPLPTRLDALLDGDAQDRVAGWLGAELSEAYASCRRNDVRHAAERDFDALSAELGLVY
jgi:glutamine synthetase